MQSFYPVLRSTVMNISNVINMYLKVEFLKILIKT